MNAQIMTNVKGVDLGVNNLKSISDFTQSASSLGLISDNTTKLTSFVGTSAGLGGLSSGALTEHAVMSCMSAGIDAGILAVTAPAEKVRTLLNSAKRLGVTVLNVKNQIDSIMKVAGKNGLIPSKIQAINNGTAVSHHKLKFAPFDMSDILEVCISQMINDHGRLYVKGILKPQGGSEDQMVHDTGVGKAAALYSVDENGKVETLFIGIVLKVTQNQSGDLKYFEVEVISQSYNLDITKNSRSFQKKTAVYCSIIDQVNNGVAQIRMEVEDKTTDKLIVQYRETDWNMLIRLGSHFNTGLVPVCNSEYNQIYFGIPIGTTPKEISIASYCVQKDLEKYSEVSANNLTHSNPSVADVDYTTYKVQSLERLNIGDAVTFLKHTLYVKQIKGQLEKGILTFYYYLSSKQGMVQKDLFNDNQIGVSLMGQVKVITKDQIKVHITEIDAQWDDENDWYFPYSTLFSSPDGSGWYAMPEPGDTVRVHFPNHREEDAVASSSVNKEQSAQSQQRAESGGGGGGSGDSDDAPRSDPDKKSLSNKYGKEVLFTPEGIFIINQGGQMFINLTDDDGITIVSAKDVVITAKENIYMKADKEMLITAGETLTIKGNTSSIIMDTDNIIKIEGNQVKTN